MASVVVPGLDLVPSIPSRIVTVDVVDQVEGAPEVGAKIDFVLPQDIHARADGKILKAGTTTLTLDSSGHGEIRLPCYSSASRPEDWVILVKKHWAPYPYPIRVPAGSTKISLASLEPPVEVSDAMSKFVPTDAAVRSIKEGAQWAASAEVDGGIINLDFVVPPGGEAWSKGALTTSSVLDSLTAGVYAVPSGSMAETLGLPVVRAGTLEVFPYANGTWTRRFTTNNVSSSLATEVWLQSSANNGAWTRPWVKIFPLDNVAGKNDLWVKGNAQPSVSGATSVDDLAFGIWEIRSASVANTLGLPVPRVGVLEKLAISYDGVLLRFTTNNVSSSSDLEVWQRATGTGGAWTGSWVKTFPQDISSHIDAALNNYATHDYVADAIAAASSIQNPFGLDPDGTPYILIGDDA